MSNPFNWQFLQEPLYRWFLFVVVMILFLATWADALRYMKKAAEA